MSYVALYRKWRPSVFEDVVEQEHIVKTLRNSVITGRIAHAYLFCGTRGTGKTTMAKIFARAINCLNPNSGDPCNKCEICKGILNETILDVIEIDAASNNSVDNIREIRDEVIYAPSRAKYKVYIIDEVHMLSTGAFNALLKTLEEPPQHVVFILATTDPQKIPATILSRCQRFDFRRISITSIMDRLDTIARANGVTIQKEAARLIARMSDGALRDAISILDQCISIDNDNKEISYDDVLNVIGMADDSFISNMVETLKNKDVGRTLKLVDKLVMEGKDIGQFVSELVLYYRNLLICKIVIKPEEIIDVSLETLKRMKEQCVELDREEIIFIIKELSSLEAGLRWAAHPRVLLEVCLIKICNASYSIHYNDILDRLAILEKKLAGTEFELNKPGNESIDVFEHKADTTSLKPSLKSAEKSIEKKRDRETGFKKLENWDEILNEFKNSGRMVIYTNLLGTKAVEIDEKVIGIVFESGSGFKKMIVSKTENLEVIEDTVRSKLGKEIRVKCIDEDMLNEESKKHPKHENEDFLQKAQEFAKRLNINLNIIDE